MEPNEMKKLETIQDALQKQSSQKARGAYVWKDLWKR